MKVFLSHSSKDKGFVEAVAGLLRPGSFEMDSETFDSGLINSQAIITALKRCDLFCLFLSEASCKSPFVDFETLLGIELFASGKISRFIAICLDDKAFDLANVNVKFFNIVRKTLDVESTARLIQGNLISAAELRKAVTHPFIGREDELIDLEAQVSDQKRVPPKALFISGNFGVGRRTIAENFYRVQYPKVGRYFAEINIDQFAGLEELFRKIISVLRPAITISELKKRIQTFQIARDEEKSRLIAQLLNSLLGANEAAFLIDKGGILTDESRLTEEVNAIVSKLESKPHPPIIFIAPRMIKRNMRRSEDDIAYLAVQSLKYELSGRLVKKLLKDGEVSASDEEINELIKLGDGHPFNIYRMMDEAVEIGITAFLANPGDLIDWKHRQSSEYLTKINFSEQQRLILGLLKELPELDFESIIGALEIEAESASEDLRSLVSLHIVESVSGTFIVSPPLRTALERDKRMRLSAGKQQFALKTLSRTLSIRLDAGTAPVALVDSAVLSSLESGNSEPDLTAAFLLPSHQVWLAKRHYDRRHWAECIRFATEALNGAARLSADGHVAARRFLCLAASRLGQADIFDAGIAKLEAVAKSDWAKSNVAFLHGFNWRLRGNLPTAESFFRTSYDLSPGNLPAAREIASICLARNNLDEAERFAREAQSHAPTNSYLLDILIAVLVRRHGRNSKYVTEINDLFDMLEKVGDEESRSFFAIRKAEFEHLYGNNQEALKVILSAIEITPSMFEPRRIQAEIYLKGGNRTKAYEIITKMREIVNSRDPNERRSNYRLYLEVHSKYLQEIEQWDEAKAIFDDSTSFTEKERIAAVREIEFVQAYKTKPT